MSDPSPDTPNVAEAKEFNMKAKRERCTTCRSEYPENRNRLATGYCRNDFHGPLPEGPRTEGWCESCGAQNPIWTSPLWLEIIGSTSGVLCPRCFVFVADDAGYDKTIWSLRPHEDQPPGDIAALADFLGGLSDLAGAESERIARCILDRWPTLMQSSNV